MKSLNTSTAYVTVHDRLTSFLKPRFFPVLFQRDRVLGQVSAETVTLWISLHLFQPKAAATILLQSIFVENRYRNDSIHYNVVRRTFMRVRRDTLFRCVFANIIDNIYKSVFFNGADIAMQVIMFIYWGIVTDFGIVGWLVRSSASTANQYRFGSLTLRCRVVIWQTANFHISSKLQSGIKAKNRLPFAEANELHRLIDIQIYLVHAVSSVICYISALVSTKMGGNGAWHAVGCGWHDSCGKTEITATFTRHTKRDRESIATNIRSFSLRYAESSVSRAELACRL